MLRAARTSVLVAVHAGGASCASRPKLAEPFPFLSVIQLRGVFAVPLVPDLMSGILPLTDYSIACTRPGRSLHGWGQCPALRLRLPSIVVWQTLLTGPKSDFGPCQCSREASRRVEDLFLLVLGAPSHPRTVRHPLHHSVPDRSPATRIEFAMSGLGEASKKRSSFSMLTRKDLAPSTKQVTEERLSWRTADSFRRASEDGSTSFLSPRRRRLRPPSCITSPNLQRPDPPLQLQAPAATKNGRCIGASEGQVQRSYHCCLRWSRWRKVHAGLSKETSSPSRRSTIRRDIFRLVFW